MMLKKWFSYSWVLYVIVGSILLLFCDFKQARVQRIYDLDLYKHFLTDCLNQCDDPDEIRLALRYYTMLGQYHPDMARTDEMRGLCYVLLGENHQALGAFSKVLKSRPGFFWVEFDKGMALYHLHQWKDALDIFSDIAARSDKEMLYAGLLPSVRFLPIPLRDPLVRSLQEFIMKVKIDNDQMITHCLAQDSDVKQDFLEVHPWGLFSPSVMQPFKD